MLEVRLFGQFDVRENGESIQIASRPAQSLLAYLMLTSGTAHRREKLAGLLWPDSSEENARSNLRQALWRIRKALNGNSHPEQPFLFSDQFTVEFNPNASYWLDAAVLEKQAREITVSDPLMEVLGHYRGELLPGFYDDWVLLEREHLQSVFDREAERLLELLQDEQHWKEILEWGEQWLAHGQSSEPAYRALMIAHGALGNRSKVAYTYERCVKALRDELGVKPSEQTRQLYEQLIQGDQPVEPALASVPAIPTSNRRLPPDRSPYKGLLYFEEADANLFFGRGQLTSRLVDRLHRERILALVGASGSGKSSLVRAGLVPAIKCGGNYVNDSPPLDNGQSECVQVITPTELPLESLASTLVNIPGSLNSTVSYREELERDPLCYARSLSQLLPDGTQFVLVVDQFEELFTLCHDPFEREAFVDHLLSAVSSESEVNILLVLALRADFYVHCAQYPSLRKVLVEHQEYLGSMSAEELRLAIEGPAQLDGWELEAGLGDLILVELGDEPGKLPLLSHALLETWNRRRGQTLTLKGYTDSGGVRGAISRTAENVYQKLAPDQREIARTIFLDLTELGEGTTDTRRRVALTDILDHGDGTRIQEVLNLLAGARLVTLGEDTIEVAHEALIRTWGRLRTWLDNSRDELRQRRMLMVVAHEWDKAGQDASYLAVGTRLAEFEALGNDANINLGQLELAFLAASLTERDRKQTREQKRIAHEIRLEQRSRNILRALVVVLLVATIGAFTLTGLAWNQRRIASQNEIAAQVLALTSGAQIAANQGDAELALALALSANQLDQASVQAYLTLSDLAYAPGIRQRMLDHVDQVSAVAFAPGGEQALSASWDKTLVLWDVSSGQPVRRFNGHSGPVISVAYNHDGSAALSGSEDGTLILWDVNSGNVLRRFEGHTGEITSVAISPDGKLGLSSSSDQTLILWDLASGEIIHTLIGHTGEVQNADFSPDGRWLVSGSSDNTLILWEASTGEILHRFEGHLGAVTAVAFSPDGKNILSGSLDQVLILWDAASGEPVRRYEGHQDQVNAAAFSPDGKTALSASGSEEVFNTSLERALILWDVTSGEMLRRFEGHAGPITAVAFSPDGKTALSGSSDMSMILWGLTHGAEVQRLEAHTSAINVVDMSLDGETALSGSADASLMLWDVSDGTPIQQIIVGTTIHAAALSPDGQNMLTGSPDGRLRLWDVTTGQAVHDLVGHTGQVTSLSFSPDGKTALSGSLDRKMILWDLSTGQAIHDFDGHTNAVTSVAIREDGKLALSASYDRTLILWDLEIGQMVRSFPVQESVINTAAFSPDGKTGLAGQADGVLILWDLQTGAEMRRFSGHSGPVYAVKFSPDGRSALSGSMDGSMILWDIASGQPISRYLGHTDAIRAVEFSPDGHTAVSGSLDSSLRVWRIDTLEDLISWTEANRFVMDLPCEQRELYHVEPLCESGEPTPPPVP